MHKAAKPLYLKFNTFKNHFSTAEAVLKFPRPVDSHSR